MRLLPSRLRRTFAEADAEEDPEAEPILNRKVSFMARALEPILFLGVVDAHERCVHFWAVRRQTCPVQSGS